VRYIPGPSIDEPIAMETASTGAKEYFHTDKQGSVSAMSDVTGALVEGPYTYDAYGNCFVGSTPCSNTGEPYRFTGRRFDAETGLYYYRGRYYDPAKGRFLQTDTVGYEADLNLYTYVGNDPIDRNDPSGRDTYNCEVTTVGGFTVNVRCADEDTGQQLNFLQSAYVYTHGTPVSDQSNDHSSSGNDGNKTSEGRPGIGHNGGPPINDNNQNNQSPPPVVPPPPSHNQSPSGSKKSPMEIKPGANKATNIAGRDYTGHAQDRMQGRGIPPSAVENTIRTGISSPGRVPGTTVHYDPVNDITVVTDTATGRVVTTHFGPE